MSTNEAGLSTNANARMAIASGNSAGHSTSSGRPSESSDTPVDWVIYKLNTTLRSIVMNKETFELFIGFNKESINTGNPDNKESTKADDEFLGKIIPKINFLEASCRGLLSGPASNSKLETAIAITERMVLDLQQSKFNFTAFSEAKLPDDGTTPYKRLPRLDITIGSTGSNILLAFTKVGLIKSSNDTELKSGRINDLFWSKVEQALNYLDRLSSHGGMVSMRKGKGDAEEIQLTARGTILFSVLVFDKEKEMGRLAVFTAELKSDGKFRVALLWRIEASGDDNNAFHQKLDAGYGAFINATEYLARLKHSNNNNNDDAGCTTWEYLGPNCSKVTTNSKSYVLRAYDNRVRSTPRSPYLYHKYDPLSEETTNVLKVIDEREEGDVLEFGNVKASDPDSRLSMLFLDAKSDPMKGQVEVIAVRFYEGSHECTSIDQAIAVVKFIKHMHDNDFVHGDIRGFNLVFTEDGGGVPIDFDFGGTHGEATYPPGYVVALSDGLRDGHCMGGKRIKPSDDFEAMKYVLLWLHTIRVFPDDIKTMDDFLKSLDEQKKQASKVNATILYNSSLNLHGEHKVKATTVAASGAATRANNTKKTPFGAQTTPLTTVNNNPQSHTGIKRPFSNNTKENVAQK